MVRSRGAVLIILLNFLKRNVMAKTDVKVSRVYPVAEKLDKLMHGKMSSQGITGLRKALENDPDRRAEARSWYSCQSATDEQKFRNQYPALYELVFK